MLFTAEVFERAACTAADKASLARLAGTMVGLAEKAAQEGLLALGNDAGEGDTILSRGLRMVIDGVEQERLQTDLRKLALAGGLGGKALLARMLVAEGILGINAGLRPELIRLKLLAYLGEEVCLTAWGQSQAAQPK
jgi:flagellar motor component MotA